MIILTTVSPVWQGIDISQSVYNYTTKNTNHLKSILFTLKLNTTHFAHTFRSIYVFLMTMTIYNHYFLTQQLPSDLSNLTVLCFMSRTKWIICIQSKHILALKGMDVWAFIPRMGFKAYIPAFEEYETLETLKNGDKGFFIQWAIRLNKYPAAVPSDTSSIKYVIK